MESRGRCTLLGLAAISNETTAVSESRSVLCSVRARLVSAKTLSKCVPATRLCWKMSRIRGLPAPEFHLSGGESHGYDHPV